MNGNSKFGYSSTRIFAYSNNFRYSNSANRTRILFLHSTIRIFDYSITALVDTRSDRKSHEEGRLLPLVSALEVFLRECDIYNLHLTLTFVPAFPQRCRPITLSSLVPRCDRSPRYGPAFSVNDVDEWERRVITNLALLTRSIRKPLARWADTTNDVGGWDQLLDEWML